MRLPAFTTKRFFFSGAILLAALLFISGAIGSLYHIVMDSRNRAQYIESAEKAEYHYMAIFPSMEEDFFTDLWEGVRSEAEKKRVAVELQVPEDKLDLKKKIIELLNIARLSKVDGVALYVTHETELSSHINRLSLSGIPVVTLESDAPKSRRASFIGSNSFHLGQRIGSLMQEIHHEKVRAAILRSQYYSEKTTQWSIINYGILTSFSSRHDDTILTSENSGSGVLSGEELTQKLLFLYPELNSIFCMSRVDTVAAYRTVQEFRRDRSVRIFGYGYGEEIQKGLENGTIYATVVRKPKEMGARAVETLKRLSQNKFVSSFIYIPNEIRKTDQSTPMHGRRNESD